MGRLGAHVSISGGVANSVRRALELELDTFQIFSRNQRQWMPPPLAQDDIFSFRKGLKRTSLGPVLVHSSYLINLANPDEKGRERSLLALVDEMTRCSFLGLDRLVLHPGSHKGSGVQAGIENIANCIDKAYSMVEDNPPKILLETTAGQGNGIGSTFQELSGIMDRTAERTFVCLDTCHMHAAGYDLLSRETYDSTMKELDSIIGRERVLGIHLNDSIKAMGSRVDRHTNIGEGTLGIEPFGYLLDDAEFKDVPMILETPGGEEGYRKDLSLLRSLVE
jgi:deoxyribonuclease-4